MLASSRFRVHTPRVVHEPFESEVVIVNLDSGRYYCLQGSGVTLWNGVTAGASVEDIARGLAERYDAAPETVEAAVRAVIGDLLREDLIGEAADAGQPDPAWPPVHAGAKLPFTAPRLDTYTDMQDLLLLDPIHEVDAAGWPVPANAGKGPATTQE